MAGCSFRDEAQVLMNSDPLLSYARAAFAQHHPNEELP